MKFLLPILAFIFLSIQIKLPKSVKQYFTFVPSGIALIGNDSLSVQSFYMQRYEVTNGEYQVFLKWLSENGSEDNQKQAQILNDNWNSEWKLGMPEVAKNYHIHEGFKNYPVVNITYQAALLYCGYLENKINRELKEGRVKVRLPSHAEFIRAGAGDSLTASYAWRDQYMQQPNGNFRANFIRILQSSLTRDEDGNFIVHSKKENGTIASTDLIAPSKSYWEYSYGFYNLNGNVAEMINESGVAVGGSFSNYGYDIRLQSTQEYTAASCKVGFRPVFTFVTE